MSPQPIVFGKMQVGGRRQLSSTCSIACTVAVRWPSTKQSLVEVLTFALDAAAGVPATSKRESTCFMIRHEGLG